MGWPGPMTHRQCDAWQSWLRLQWERPSRGDWYTMRLTMEVRKIWNGLTGQKTELKDEEFRVKFADGDENSGAQNGAAGKANKGKGRTPEEQAYVDKIERAKAAAADRAFWFAATGMNSPNSKQGAQK